MSLVNVLGESLASAVAIAVSPIPIIAVILMLMSTRARSLGWGFLAGWLVGIALATTLAVVLAGYLPPADASSGSKPVTAAIFGAIGLGLLALAVKQWSSRPRPGQEAVLPPWMAKIDTMRAPAAAGLGFVLAAINPKNLMMAVTGGAVIAGSGLAVPDTVWAVVIFVVIAALSVVVPVVAAACAPRAAAGFLATTREWLTANNATIMAVLLAVIGAHVIGKALAAI